MRAFFGIVIAPSPKGQTPASARNKVDLPAPDGPLTSTRSPSLIVMSFALISGTPLGSRTDRSLKLTAFASAGATAMTGGVTAASRAAAIELIEARQSFDHRAPFRELPIDVDENRQCALNLTEGVCRLHQSAELHLRRRNRPG